MEFSKRMGFQAIRTVIQTDSMDQPLRNALWNTVLKVYFTIDDGRVVSLLVSDYKVLIRRLWTHHFGLLIDDLPPSWGGVRQTFRKMYFDDPWYRAYDFIEFLPNNFGNVSSKFASGVNLEFITTCNKILEGKVSGFRFVGSKIAQIVSEPEIAAVEQAMRLDQPLASVSLHIETALKLLSDRQAPDYRNSIKESISAVESLCVRIAGKKTELGPALRAIENQSGVDLHPALRQAFEKLYGYTSNAEGIRHALTDEPSLDAEDAAFMLVTCSAFINYLVNKTEKAGIQL